MEYFLDLGHGIAIHEGVGQKEVLRIGSLLDFSPVRFMGFRVARRATP